MTTSAQQALEVLEAAAIQIDAAAQCPDANQWVMRFPSGLYVFSAETNSGLLAALRWPSSIEARAQAGDIRDGQGDHPTPYTVRQAAELDLQSLRKSIETIRAIVD